jgi:fluoride exporter
VSPLYLAVAATGALGAPARYLVDLVVSQRRGGVFPWGTFVVNASGAFVLGVVTGLALHHGLSDSARTVLGTGLCGAYTTFSTFGYETVRLLEDRAWREAVLNVVGSLAVGLLAGAAGLSLAVVV